MRREWTRISRWPGATGRNGWCRERSRRSGPTPRCLPGEAGEAVRKLKAETVGDINVAGPELAASLSALGLIDEYVLFLVPVVLGGGKPFFAAGAPLELQLVGVEELPDGVTALKYQPSNAVTSVEQ